MTDGELQTLREKGEEILELAKGEKRYEFRKDLHREYDIVMERILREEDRRDAVKVAAEEWHARDLNPNPRCPACGHALVKK